jgi:hypothetical protein
VDKEYTAGEAKAWLNGYDEGKKIRTSERSIQISDNKEAESARAWVGFTQEEHQAAIWTDGSYGAGFLHAEKLLKEKNT